jgi:membrane protein DedA with SNARE-associated domain
MVQFILYLLKHYGYPVILLGTFFDSELAVILLGGIAARFGYMDLLPVIFCCYAGTLMGDQFYFWLARWKGEQVLSHMPWLKRGVDRLEEEVGERKVPKILVFRFLLGLRIPPPIFLGMGKDVSYFRFLLFDVPLLMVWSVSLSIIGYGLGRWVEIHLPVIERYQYYVLALVVIILAPTWVYQWWSHRK